MFPDFGFAMGGPVPRSERESCSKGYLQGHPFGYLTLHMNQPKYPLEEGLERLRRWCDLQERCLQEARRKLRSWGYDADTINDWLDQMQARGALDESRFARAFVSGKFRIKRWGKRKIQAELQFRGVRGALIHEALSTIPEEAYRTALHQLALRRLSDPSDQGRAAQGKAARYLISKGYEPDLVWETVGQIAGR